MSKGLQILYVSIIVIGFVALGIWYLSTTDSTTISVAPAISTPIKSSDKLINSFNFLGLSKEEDGAIDDTNYVINLVVPVGTNLTKLTPTISISDNATISPASDVAQDFTNPVTGKAIAKINNANVEINVMIRRLRVLVTMRRYFSYMGNMRSKWMIP